jgi:hypothetical protein
MDVVASSWRYFSTQSIISLHRPIILPSVKRRCDHPNTNDHAGREQRLNAAGNHEPETHRDQGA